VLVDAGQSAFRLASLAGFHLERDHVGQGRRKILFLQGPLARRPDVFVTDHAEGLAVQVDGNVHQSADAQGFQITGEELARPRVLPNVVDGHDATVLNGLDVAWVIARGDPCPALVGVVVPAEQVLADEVRLTVVEEPDRDAVDAERCSRLLRGRANHGHQVFVAVLAQLDERSLMVHDPLGPLFEHLFGPLSEGHLAEELLVGRRQLHRALGHAALQLLVGLDQGRIALLNLFEHLVERLDQQSYFIAPVGLGADGVLLLLRHEVGQAGQRQNGRRDGPLKPGGDQIRPQRGDQDDADHDDDAVPELRVHGTETAGDADRADVFIVELNGSGQDQQSVSKHVAVGQLLMPWDGDRQVAPIHREKPARAGVQTGGSDGGHRLHRAEDLVGVGGILEGQRRLAVVRQDIGMGGQVADHSAPQAGPFPRGEHAAGQQEGAHARRHDDGYELVPER